MFGWLRKLILFLKPTIKAFWKVVISSFQYALKDIALKVVQEIKDDPKLLTNEEKREEAFRRIKATANLRGMELKDHVVNRSIELAVSLLKFEGKW